MLPDLNHYCVCPKYDRLVIPRSWQHLNLGVPKSCAHCSRTRSMFTQKTRWCTCAFNLHLWPSNLSWDLSRVVAIWCVMSEDYHLICVLFGESFAHHILSWWVFCSSWPSPPSCMQAGKTAYDHAVQSGNEEVIELLKQVFAVVTWYQDISRGVTYLGVGVLGLSLL